MYVTKQPPQARHYYAGDVIEFTFGECGDTVNTKSYTVLTPFDLKAELKKYRKMRGEMYQSCSGAAWWLIDNLDLEEFEIQVINLGSYDLEDLEYADNGYDSKLNENKG